MTEQEKRLAAELLERIEGGSANPAELRAVVGLDGFVDEIVHIVKKRTGADSYSRIETIKEFSERIASFSEKSGNIEMVTKIKKLGGNGPIMANALTTLGAETAYIGNVGVPEPDPVFADMAKKMQVYSLGEACHTDAAEFNDGKIMLGKMEPISQITWERIIETITPGELEMLLAEADLLALVNWTMVTYMSDIWERLLEDMCPQLPYHEDRYVFFDLADPEKRDRADVRRMLELIPRFSKFYRVILGLNERESFQVAAALELKVPDSGGPENISEVCRAISGALGIFCVVIHPIEYAVATLGGVTYVQEGPVTQQPKITTGAGDHFNSGFCLGLLLDADPQTALLMGVCASGYYVMNAESPNLRQLAGFMARWRDIA